MSETIPNLIRRSDGERFAITMQARSPDGPVTLRQVSPPHAIVDTTNDRLRADFFDPKDSGSPPLAPLLGAHSAETEKRDPDPTVRGAPGERITRFG